ncbi:MAG: glycerophosphodiester phosphodiesterase [Streptosporangiales bacterium]|nr:glycerophosphodiester phosphodiesterase [Streptosporangiales bacterium]
MFSSTSRNLSLADDSYSLPSVTIVRKVAPLRDTVDLQGHRGARGLRPENTLPAFAKALEVGVTTLELDVGITGDGAVVVSHDAAVSPLKCEDTDAVEPDDPLFPYVGRPLAQLTLDQVKTLECGVRRPRDMDTDPFVGSQLPIPGTAMPTLDEVFDLVDGYGADDVRFNVETKIRPTQPSLTVDPQTFAERVIEVVREHGMTHRTTLQSFDWRTLLWADRLVPEMERSALVDTRTFERDSPWLAGLDLTAFSGDVAAAAEAIGASVLSPEHVLVTDDLLGRAHGRALPVVTWTVNDPERIAELLDLGVDGIITDFPDRARLVLEGHGRELPTARPEPAHAEIYVAGV